MKLKLFFLWVIVTHLIAFHDLYCVDVEINSDTNATLIGQRILVNYKFTLDKTEEAFLPSLADTLGLLEVVSRTKIDTQTVESNRIFSQSFEVTSFDTGSIVLPPLTFLYKRKGFDTPNSIESNSLLLNFSTVVVDTAQGFRDIKEPLEYPFDWFEFLKYLLLAILIVGAIIWLVYYINNKKKKAIVSDKKEQPKIPAHILAIEALKQLEAKKLWQAGEVKKYHTELTDILRLYIERVSPIMALEMTSDDLKLAVKEKYNQSIYESMVIVLDIADMAKFAKSNPLPEENQQSMTLAMQLVEEILKFNESKKA